MYLPGHCSSQVQYNSVQNAEAAQLMGKCSGDETTLSREKLLLS